MSEKRTITNLLNSEKRVYLYIVNEAVWKIFAEQATSEGFLWADGRKMKKVMCDDIVAVNNNMTFNYVGFIGHIRMGCQNDDTLCKIDFA